MSAQNELQQQQKSITDTITLYEDLLGQNRLSDVNDYLLQQNTGIVGDFFKIINDFSQSKAAFNDIDKKHRNKEIDASAYATASTSYDDALTKFNKDLKEFFKNNGASFDKTGIIVPGGYENSSNKQAAVYFLSYIHENFSVKEGEVQRKNTGSDPAVSSDFLELLENANFSSAYTMRALKPDTDPDHVPAILLKGANLGNMDCRYGLAERYLSHLAGTASQDKPQSYDFPKGVDQEKIINWIENARDAGYVKGLANMQNYIGNVIGAVGAIFQQETKSVTKEQIDRLKEMADIAKKISGDQNLNGYINNILELQNDTQKSVAEKIVAYNSIKKAATNYLEKDYGNQFKITTAKVDGTLKPLIKSNLSVLQKWLSELVKLVDLVNNKMKDSLAKLEKQDKNAYSKLDAVKDRTHSIDKKLAVISGFSEAISRKLSQEDLLPNDYSQICWNSAIAVNELRYMVNHQPHPNAVKAKINEKVDAILQLIRPREDKPYALFVSEQQKVESKAAKEVFDKTGKMIKEVQSNASILTSFTQQKSRESKPDNPDSTKRKVDPQPETTRSIKKGR